MNTQEDPLIICSMGPGLWTKQGHFIVLWDIENGIAHINDPASTSQPRTENSYKYMASQCKQYFCFNRPLPKEEPTQEVSVESSIMTLDKSSLETLSIIKNEIEEDKVFAQLLPFNKNNSYLFQNYN